MMVVNQGMKFENTYSEIGGKNGVEQFLIKTDFISSLKCVYR